MLTCITDPRRPQLLHLDRWLDVDELGRRIDILVLVAARGEKRREAEERESAHHGVAPSAVGRGRRQRIALERHVFPVEALLLGIGRERCVVRATRAGDVALRNEGVAAYVVEVRRERACLGRVEQRQCLVGLRLLDKHAREPYARNLAELRVARAVDYGPEAFRRLVVFPAVDGGTSQRQVRLVRIGRGRVRFPQGSGAGRSIVALVGRQRLDDTGVRGLGLFGLLPRVRLPVAPTGDRAEPDRDATDQRHPVVAPEAAQLFFAFKITQVFHVPHSRGRRAPDARG